jgi:hypothetical protein
MLSFVCGLLQLAKSKRLRVKNKQADFIINDQFYRGKYKALLRIMFPWNFSGYKIKSYLSTAIACWSMTRPGWSIGAQPFCNVFAFLQSYSQKTEDSNSPRGI